MFKAGILYEKNLLSPADITVNQGGTSSGKTYSILQAGFTLLVENPGWTMTVVGQDIPNLKKGPIKDAHAIIESSPILRSMIRSYNKSDRIFTLVNGAKMEFTSYDNAQDAKSGRREILYINEANGISYDIFEQLYIRTFHRTFVDYNPDVEFWVHDILLKDSALKLEMIISDHRHNPFIPDSLHDKIERLKERDYNLWKVYARGLTGKLEGLVFRNWDNYSPGHGGDFLDNGLPIGTRFLGYGMDFGYTNDPTTLLGIWKKDKDLYIEEHLYDYGLTGKMIDERMTDLGISRTEEIRADSGDPRLIKELRGMNWNVKGAEKGPDSVMNGIDILQRYKIHLMPGSSHTQKEFRSYKWQVNKDGKSLNKPVDAMNHSIDAIRYGIHSVLKRPDNKGSRFGKNRFA